MTMRCSGGRLPRLTRTRAPSSAARTTSSMSALAGRLERLKELVDQRQHAPRSPLLVEATVDNAAR